MSITVHIIADTAADLAATLKELAGVMPGAGAVAAPAQEAPKRKRTEVKPEPQDAKPEEVKPEEAKPEEKAPEPEDAKEPEQAEPENAEPENAGAEEVSLEDLRAKAAAVAKTNQMGVKELLADFGVKAVSNIPEERRAEFMERLEALANG